MISIITAIHNGLAVNRLFLKSLQKNTRVPYELIIVDNHSTDGSTELFEQAGATVIRNEENHCYPESQNMGMEVAQGEYFAFLNNDIYLAPDWDVNMLEAMNTHTLDIAGLGSFEVLYDPKRRRKFGRRWKWLRRGKRHVRMNTASLERLMNKLYGRQGFEAWARNEARRFNGQVYPGITGSALVTTRSVWDKLGPWDVAMEASDWHLMILASKRAEEIGDLNPPAIVPSSLHHHFARLTFHSNPEPRACKHTHLRLEDRWSSDEIQRYGPSLPQENSKWSSARKLIKSFRIDRRKTDREKVDTQS